MSRDGVSQRWPELDGLRALAVVPVVAYHFGASVNGGAGVTVFFALSGYLVTTLLLEEQRQNGAIRVGDFYMRRFRRLLPAATVVVLATVIVGRMLQKPPIVRPAVAALTYWADIERYTSHYSYGQSSYAPLEHFWSLAIEEQFYLVLPLVCLVLLPMRRRWFASVVTLCLGASAAFAFIHRADPQMYFHPAARACELLAGVLCAVIGRRVPAWVGYAGLAGLICVLAGVVSLPPVLTASLTCLVIAGRPRLLALTPLVVIGTYSYGIYLWHPLSAVLSDRLFVRVALTVGCAVISFAVVEVPVRRRASPRLALMTMGMISATAFIVVLLPERAPSLHFAGPAVVVAAPLTATTEAPLAATTAATPAIAAATTSTATPTTVAVKPLRISGAGDSSQMFTDAAWEAWAAENPQTVTWVRPPDDIVPWTSGADGWLRDVGPGAGLVLPTDGPQGGIDRQGCPLIYDFPIRAVAKMKFTDSAVLHSATPVASCDWHLWMPAALAEMHIDVLVVSWAVTAMWEYQMPDGHVAHVGDADFDELLTQRMSDFEAMAATYGTKVLWLTYQPISNDPHPDRWVTPEAADAFAAIAETRACFADLRTAIRDDPQFDWYLDGYHFTNTGAARAVAVVEPSLERCSSLP